MKRRCIGDRRTRAPPVAVLGCARSLRLWRDSFPRRMLDVGLRQRRIARSATPKCVSPVAALPPHDDATLANSDWRLLISERRTSVRTTVAPRAVQPGATCSTSADPQVRQPALICESYGPAALGTSLAQEAHGSRCRSPSVRILYERWLSARQRLAESSWRVPTRPTPIFVIRTQTHRL